MSGGGERRPSMKKQSDYGGSMATTLELAGVVTIAMSMLRRCQIDHDRRVRWENGSVAAQISVAARLNTPEVKTTIVDCLVTLIEVIQSDTILKAMNLNILMNTRSEDSRVRLLALTCGEALWRGHGGKLMGM